MLRRLLMSACLMSLACRVPGPVIPSGESASLDGVWVDGTRRGPGDGSKGRPFSTLEEALRHVEAGGSSLRVHLASGRYPGPFVLPAGLELVGAGEGSVLHAEGAEPVVRAPEGATLRGLGVQGGSWGLEAAGPVRLEAVRFGGQVAGAVRMGEGSLRVEGGVFEGRGVGLFIQRGSLRLEDVTVIGYEYGVQSVEASVETRGLTSVRAALAGVVLIGTRGRLEDTVVLGSGGHGGLLLVGSELELRGVRVDGAEAYGISATRGRLRVRRAIITRLTTREGDSGDGLHLRDVEAEVEDLVVRDVAGVGVLGAQGARVTLRDVSLEDCREAGVLAETLGQVKAVGLEVRGSGGPALAAMDDGVLRVEALTARDNAAGLVWADCQGGTAVTLRRVTGQGAAGTEGACVTSPSP
jgi:hypothetical protein